MKYLRDIIKESDTHDYESNPPVKTVKGYKLFRHEF